MRFRNKLLLFLVISTVTSTVAVLVLFEYYSYAAILREMKEKALAIVRTAAVSVDGNLHSKIRVREDENGEAYKTVREHLRKIRDANRRDNTFVQYLYTIMPAPDQSHRLVFGVDPEESAENQSHVGDPILNQEVLAWHLEKTEVGDDFIKDQWGTWLSAHAPIFDSSGKMVAAVAIDIPKWRIDLEYSLLGTKGALAIGVGLMVSFFTTLVIARKVTKPLEDIHHAVNQIAAGGFDVDLKRPGIREFDQLGDALKEMGRGLKERETVKSAFASYVSHQVVDTILRTGVTPILHGERRRVTVLFCDIKGFTSMSERLKPETVVEILNSYFEKVVDIIFKYQGTLDKFMGDGLMAIFGAPAEDPFQEEHAIRAALEMKAVLRDLSDQFLKQHDLTFGIGIGINSGIAIVGNIGSSKRMDYTAIGDTVNLAARLESKTRELNADILISEETCNAVRGAFPGGLEKVGSLTVKGRENAVTTYAVLEPMQKLSQSERE